MEKGDTSDFGTDSNSGQRAADADKTADEQTDSHTDEHHTTAQDGRFPVSRRATLASVATLAGLGLLSDSAQAQQGPPVPGPKWNRDVDADGNGLFNLGSLTMLDNPTPISDFEGANLSIDAGVLNATDTRTNVSDDGSQVVTETTDIDFTTGLTATADSDGSASVGLTDDSITITPGDHLTGGGPVALGESVTLNVTDDWVDIGGDTMQGSLNMGTNGVSNVGSLAMADNPTAITDFEGTNLSIDAGVLNVTATDTRTNVSDDGSQVVANATDINFRSNLAVSNDGDGSVTVDASSSQWADTDSDLLLEASGFDGIDVNRVRANTIVETQQVGTRTNTPLEAVANGERALRIEPTPSEYGANIIGGHPSNSVSAGVRGATVAGGGASSSSNAVTHDFGTVSGGRQNRAVGVAATVGGGEGNNATGSSATVGGGQANNASSSRSTICGGNNNSATGDGSTVSGGTGNRSLGSNATVGGGQGNSAVGPFATIPGGQGNSANQQFSFAAGRSARSQHSGAMVFGDSSITTVSSQTNNQFVVQAGGGALIYSNSNLSAGVRLNPGSGSWSSLSSRAAKTNIQSVDSEAVLDAVDSLELSTWEYDSEENAVHMGPMAEEFYDAFGLGDSERRISTVDADGVALAAIQGLSAKLDDKDGRIDELEQVNGALRERCDTLEERLTALEAQAT